MATPKTPRKRASETNDASDVPPEGPVTPVQTVTPEIADAEIVPQESSETSEPETQLPEAAQAADAIAIAETPPETPPEPETAPEPEAAAESETVPEPEPEPDQAAAEPEASNDTPAASGPQLETSREIENTPAPSSGSGFMPMLLGGVVAAGIGFGLATFVVPEGWPVASDKAAVTALEARLAENARDIADMKARLEALAQAGTESTLSGELDLLGTTAANALETANNAQHAIEGLEPRLTAAEAALAALQNRPTGDPSVDSAVIDRLSADIETMRAEVEAQKAAADAAEARIAKEVELARAEAEANAQAALLRAAAAQVEAALQSGVPFAEPLAQLAAAGTQISAPLPELAEKGAPTISGLIDSFGEAARAALDVSRRENVGQSVTDRISSFLQTQTGARSLSPREGDDPDAVLSRAEAALRGGDLTGTLGLISALPATAQDAMAGWVAQANTLLSAQDAARTLSAALSEG